MNNETNQTTDADVEALARRRLAGAERELSRRPKVTLAANGRAQGFLPERGHGAGSPQAWRVH